jgi:hypothetical protein
MKSHGRVLNRSVLRDSLAVVAGLAITMLSGLLGAWLGSWLAPPRLDLDVGLMIVAVFGGFVTAVAGFVVARLANLRAVWIYALAELVLSIVGAIQFREVLWPAYFVVEMALILPCALLGGMVSNRLASGRIHRFPSG